MISELQSDYIKELFNVGMGAAASELSELINDEVFMSVPSFQLINWQQLTNTLGYQPNEAVTMVYVSMDGQLKGRGILIYPTTASLELAHRLSEDFSPLDDLTELEEEALSEISGIIINNIISTICKQLNVNAHTSLPICERGRWDSIAEKAIDIDTSHKIMFIGMYFSIKHKDLKGELLFLQDGETINELLTHTTNALKKMGVE